MYKDKLNRFKLPLVILTSVATTIVATLMVYNCVDKITMALRDYPYAERFFTVGTEVLAVIFVTGIASMSIVSSVYAYRMGWAITLLSISSFGLLFGLSALPFSSAYSGFYDFFTLLLLIVVIPIFVLSLIHLVTFSNRRRILLAEEQEANYKNVLDRDENKNNR